MVFTRRQFSAQRPPLHLRLHEHPALAPSARAHFAFASLRRDDFAPAGLRSEMRRSTTNATTASSRVRSACAPVYRTRTGFNDTPATGIALIPFRCGSRLDCTRYASFGVYAIPKKMR